MTFPPNIIKKLFRKRLQKEGIGPIILNFKIVLLFAPLFVYKSPAEFLKFVLITYNSATASHIKIP